eukprot:8826166-Prorocentrum_lima.AAC.1
MQPAEKSERHQQRRGRGGGGAARAALSQLLAELKMGGSLPSEVRRQGFQEAHRRRLVLAALERGTRQRWVAEGVAGMASHRCGHASFGG